MASPPARCCSPALVLAFLASLALCAVLLATIHVLPRSSAKQIPPNPASVYLWAAPPKRPPALAPSWKAKVTLLGGGYIYNDTSGMFYSDSAHQRFRLSVKSHTSVYKQQEVQDVDLLIKNVPGFYMNFTYGVGDAGICHPFTFPGKSYATGGGDPFWWVPLAQFNSTITSGDITCDSFVFALGAIQASICIGSDGAPRYLAHSPVTSTLAYVSSVFGGLLLFSDIHVGEALDSDFAPSQQCSTDFDHPLCPDSGVVTLDVYRLQGGNEPFELANRNTGDALGDMFFTCVIGGSPGQGKRVAYYKVTANSSWGPFNQCQYDSGARNNFCVGVPGAQVGRSTPENLGGKKWAGQCTSNEDLGSWYSFPAEGQCKPGEALGTHGCTWSAKFERAVDLDCVLQDRQLAGICKKELGHPPFSRSAAIFKAALASGDPSKGGCPTAGQVFHT